MSIDSMTATTQGRLLQPLLHNLATLVRAPVMVLADIDGQIRQTGVQGLWMDDRRALCRFELSVDGAAVEPVSDHVDTAVAHHIGVCRTVGDDLPDPTLMVERVRSVTVAGMTEQVTLRSTAQGHIATTLDLIVGGDVAGLAQVKHGQTTDTVHPLATEDGMVIDAGEVTTRLTCHPAPDHTDHTTAAMRWDVNLGPGQTWTAGFVVEVSTTTSFPFQAGTDANSTPWHRPVVSSPNSDLTAVVRRGLDDLEGLLLADPDSHDRFVAAGAPWFLTLFGRDSLWAARMLLPFGTGLALSTLRVLAARQGTRLDPATEEEPGKILHEVRDTSFELQDATLPPVYYGTIDATPLWIILLVDAWRWGADRGDLEVLLPNLEAALDWTLDAIARSPTGLLQYADLHGTGLSNQGWKDSGDSVQFADGRLATPPIALVEPQAYAHEAFRGAAAMLEAFDGDPDRVQQLRDAAERLAARVHDAFWVNSRTKPHLAIAIDGAGNAVDSLTSNAGHCLGTGLLTPDQAESVIENMSSPELSTSRGLRTLTSESPRFGVLSYHGGTVWPHDTAVVSVGMAREEHLEQATTLALGLAAASPTFDHRLPELFGVMIDPELVVDYPAACRPQAWAAAAPAWAVVNALGITADAPNGRVVAPPRVDPRLAGLVIDPITIGDSQLRVEVDIDGALTVTGLSGGIQIEHVTPMDRRAIE